MGVPKENDCRPPCPAPKSVGFFSYVVHVQLASCLPCRVRAESLKIRARSPMLTTFPAVYAILGESAVTREIGPTSLYITHKTPKFVLVSKDVLECKRQKLVRYFIERIIERARKTEKKPLKIGVIFI